MDSLLPGFEFTSLVTSSELGAVYFASQRSLERQVAIKIFSPALGNDPGFRESFESASKLVAGLRHPNLIGILDSGCVGDMPYWVMEFVPGKSLARSTQGSVIDFEQSMFLIEGICDGLSEAHGIGLIHGNLDTLSILLNQQAAPKLGNFGLGRPVHTDREVNVATHTTAPEVLAKSGPATKQSDVFSLGAIFYELITGRQYGPDAQPPSELCGCKPAVDAVVKKATDPNPGSRMADAQAFQSALKDAAASRSLKSAVVAKATDAEVSKTEVSPEPVANGKKTVKVGFDWKILPKVALIVVLLFAVNLTWEARKEARAERDRENREILAKSKADKEKAKVAAAEMMARELAEGNSRNTTSPVLPEIAQRVETPGESLSRLRSALVSGSRSEMPAGSIRKGGSDFFLMTQPMTWTDAASFASEHGGHLATPDTDLSWLPEEVTKSQICWLGAARSGDESWTMVNGVEWNPDAELSGDGRYLVIGANGTFSTADEGTLRPFVIQWRSDGTNPGTFVSQLAATKGSIKAEAPVYPPGTIAYGSRHFLYVPLPVEWKEALEFAESGGGHLLVASDTEEISNLGEMTKRLEADEGIWLGGSLEGDHWQWNTGEPWTTAEWIDDAEAAEEGSALVLFPGEGWDSRDRDDEASGFIIEWSDDSKFSKAAEPVAAPGDVVADLDAKAKELVLAADKRRGEALAANVKKIRWDLDAFLRNLKKSEQDQWGPHVELLKECVKDDRLLSEEIEPRGIEVSQEMVKLVIYHTKKQGEIDAQFAADAGRIRDAFVAKMTEVRDAAKEIGQIKVFESSAEIIEEAEDLESWLRSFDLESAEQARDFE